MKLQSAGQTEMVMEVPWKAFQMRLMLRRDVQYCEVVAKLDVSWGDKCQFRGSDFHKFSSWPHHGFSWLVDYGRRGQTS
jgi:hypothetical protein